MLLFSLSLSGGVGDGTFLVGTPSNTDTPPPDATPGAAEPGFNLNSYYQPEGSGYGYGSENAILSGAQDPGYITTTNDQQTASINELDQNLIVGPGAAYNDNPGKERTVPN